MFLFAAEASAATIPVPTASEEALRQAVSDAVNGDIVDLTKLSGSIVLTNGEIVIAKSLAIQGPSARQLTISADNQSRIFRIDDGNDTAMQAVMITGVTLSNGCVTGSNGGAIWNKEQLVLNACQVTAVPPVFWTGS